jgi:hypothetical protein
MPAMSQIARGVRPFSRLWRATAPGWADTVALLLAGVAVLVIRGAEGIAEPLSHLRIAPVTLDPWNLPAYALRATLRMFAALAASPVSTPVVATLAAKSKRAESHKAPARGFRDELEDHMSEDYAAGTIDAVTQWSRYAEIFAYDEDADQFSLDDPS